MLNVLLPQTRYTTLAREVVPERRREIGAPVEVKMDAPKLYGTYFVYNEFALIKDDRVVVFSC